MKLFTILMISIFVFTGCMAKESSTFKLEPENESSYVLLGEEGKLGFHVGPSVNENGESLDYAPIVKGELFQSIWYFWGDEEELDGGLKIIGVNEKGEEKKILAEQKDGKTIKVWDYFYIHGPDEFADAQRHALMEFPDPGLWKLKVYIGEELFDNVFVDVKEK